MQDWSYLHKIKWGSEQLLSEFQCQEPSMIFALKYIDGLF